MGLGANLGDARQSLERALRWLAATPGIRIASSSKLRSTAPVGPPQPRYANAAVRIETPLAPLALLEVLKQLEAAAGRRRAVRWGPRTLDLDLLFYGPGGAMVLQTPELTLPHPHLHERRFVLEPLCDLDPDLVHPALDRSLSSLLQALA